MIQARIIKGKPGNGAETAPTEKTPMPSQARPGNKNALGNNGGAPTKYRSEYAEQVYKLCLLGAIDKEIAKFFNVSMRTLNRWKKEHEGFSNGLRRGKMIADAQVAHALFLKAIGYSYKKQIHFKSTKTDDGKEIVTVETTVHTPPCIRAIKFWLSRRQPHLWKF